MIIALTESFLHLAKTKIDFKCDFMSLLFQNWIFWIFFVVLTVMLRFFRVTRVFCASKSVNNSILSYVLPRDKNGIF